MHEEPPHRHQRALVVERRVDVGPARVGRLRNADLALRGARGVELDRGEVDRNEGMPANRMTTIATHTRFSMRIEDSTPLLPSSAPSARARSHSWITMATKGSANTPLATRMFQMPLLTIHPTSVR